MPLLFRLTSSVDLPILLVGGKPVGTPLQIRSFYRSRDLQRIVANAGAVINGALSRKKGSK
jgi:hypothetical protein